MTILQTTTRPAAWRPGEAPTAADAGLANMALAAALALACLFIAVLAYATITRLGLIWSRAPPMSCDARIRPFPHDLEVRCERDDDHDRHVGTVRDYAYPGSATTTDWHETDRRTFHGTWPGRCPSGGCVLPAGHPRDHAT